MQFSSVPAEDREPPNNYLQLNQEIWMGIAQIHNQMGKNYAEIEYLKKTVCKLAREAERDREHDKESMDDLRAELKGELDARFSQLTGFVWAGKAIKFSKCQVKEIICRHWREIMILFGLGAGATLEGLTGILRSLIGR